MHNETIGTLSSSLKKEVLMPLKNIRYYSVCISSSQNSKLETATLKAE